MQQNEKRMTCLPGSHVIATEFEDGGGVLINLNSKKYIQLNKTAMLVWRCLERELSPEDVTRELCSRYVVAIEHAQRSVTATLDTFRRYGLLQENSQKSETRTIVERA